MCFDADYRTVASLNALAQSAAAVVLPYDSTDQVTSGVLVDAIASGRPVVATAFPHAVELLASGAGIVVDHDDPGRAGSRPAPSRDRAARLAGSMAAEARRLAPTHGLVGGGHAVSEPGAAADHRTVGAGMTARTPAPVFDHLLRMTDHRGTFEHACLAEPRREARLLHRRHGSGTRRRSPATRLLRRG